MPPAGKAQRAALLSQFEPAATPAGGMEASATAVRRGLRAARLRVLHIVPRLTTGGAETMMVRLIGSLDPACFDAAAVSLFPRVGSALERRLEAAGVPVHYLDKKAGIDLGMLVRLNGLLRALRPHVVHTHLTALAHAIPALAWRRRIAVLHTVHTLADKETSGGCRALHRAAFRCGVTPVSIARAVQDSMVRVYDTPRGLLIPNGIPLEEFRGGGRHRAAFREELGLPADALLFVAAGRLTAEKNHAMAIDAFSAAFAGDGRCHLLIAGEGPLEPSLRDRAGAAAVRGRVHLLGLRQDMPRVFGASDVFVLSSNYEGHPLTMMEAMAAGLPVIGTAVGGVPEIVEDGLSGMLVPGGACTALSEAMRALSSDPVRRTAMAGAAAAAAARFDVVGMADAYADVYRSAAARRSLRGVDFTAPALSDQRRSA